LATYEVMQAKQSVAILDAYAQKSDAIYADLARVESAIVLINENKLEAAHKKLEMISLNSPLAAVSKALLHYGVK